MTVAGPRHRVKVPNAAATAWVLRLNIFSVVAVNGEESGFGATYIMCVQRGLRERKKGREKGCDDGKQARKT